MMTNPLRFEAVVEAPAETVYRAFTRSTWLRSWFCDSALVDLRVGGAMFLGWHSGYFAVGEFTVLEESSRIAFTWHGRGEPGPTQVTVMIAPEGAGSRLVVTHGGLGTGDRWDYARREFARGWEDGLENLVAALETGKDLRLVRRPLIGISLDALDEAFTAKHRIPVSLGLRLSSVSPGLGAEAAGLAADDVIVELDGRPANDYASVVVALQGKRAGDSLEVTYYRGPERRHATLPLSGRTLPDVPATPAALAAELAQTIAVQRSELAALLAGVNVAEAHERPAEGEWSPLQVLAHLLIAERDVQEWITEIISEDERVGDREQNLDTVPARIAAAVQAYPDPAAMLRALDLSFGETVALLASLPEETVRSRALYWRLGHSLLLESEHYQEHVAQLRAQLAPGA
jgi:uncharacterized protein YndB with AHSA1/START domain